MNYKLKVLIEGHTRSDGILKADIKLSLAGTDKVKDYLQSQGIDASRLAAKSFGPGQPINNSTREAAKSQDRPVELKQSDE